MDYAASKSIKNSAAFAALFASTMLCASGTAFAQPSGSGSELAADESPDNQEIIITASKRSESLQKVPISVQALGGEKLQQLNVTNFEDYSRFTPSVAFQEGQQGSTNIYIRGVASGGDGNHSGSLPSVGLYLDEQPVTTIGGTLDVHVYDIARIEVLRGPQGTLYGASSEAGTIRIITNKPDPSGFYGSADAELNTVAHGDVGGKFEAFVNAPLSATAALRVVGWYQRDAGYIDNVAGSRTFIPAPDGQQISINNAPFVKKNFNDGEVAGGRAALGIELDDSWTATLSATGQDSKSHGAFGFDPSVGDLDTQVFNKEFYHDRFIQGALTIQGKISNWDVTYAGSYMDRKINSQADYVDYAEAYDSLYQSVGGLAYYFYLNDNAGNLINPTQTVIGKDKFTKMSHELRVASPADSRFRVIAGLFYQRQKHFIHQDYQVPGLADALSVNGLPGTLWLTQQDRIDKDYAAFGEASFDILDNLTLTGGLRAYKYDNSLIGFFGFGRNPDGPPFNAVGSSRTGVVACLKDPQGNLLPPAVSGSPCTNLGELDGTSIKPKRKKGDGVTYRINLNWKITSDHMVYATWSKGFRPGGINRRATIIPYDEDTLTNYEIGFKTSWGRTLRVNGAFFWQDWKKFQFSFLGPNSFTEIHNGPDARIKGVELDVDWRPMSGLTFTGGAAFTDAKTRKNLCGFDDPSFTCTLPGPDGDDNFISAPSGTRLPVTPKFKVSGTARYEFAALRGTSHIQGSVTHQSSAASDLRTLILQSGTLLLVNPAAAQGKLHAFTMFDFAVGQKWDRISAELFVTNAFDKRAERSKFIECGQCLQRTYITPYQPRTIGVRVGTTF